MSNFSAVKNLMEDVRSNQASIHYLRDENHKPYGVVVAVKVGDDAQVGYAVQNRGPKGQPWDRDVSLAVAYGRAKKGLDESKLLKKLHNCVEKEEVLQTLDWIEDSARRRFAKFSDSQVS